MNSPNRRFPAPEQWLALDRATVSAWVRQRGGSTVAVVESTRRWYQFTYLKGAAMPASPADYLYAGALAYTNLIELLLVHGLDPLFIPVFVPQSRGSRYTEQMLA